MEYINHSLSNISLNCSNQDKVKFWDKLAYFNVTVLICLCSILVLSLLILLGFFSILIRWNYLLSLKKTILSIFQVKISDFGLSRALGVGKDYYQTNFNVNLKLPIAWYVVI